MNWFTRIWQCLYDRLGVSVLCIVLENTPDAGTTA